MGLLTKREFIKTRFFLFIYLFTKLTFVFRGYSINSRNPYVTCSFVVVAAVCVFCFFLPRNGGDRWENGALVVISRVSWRKKPSMHTTLTIDTTKDHTPEKKRVPARWVRLSTTLFAFCNQKGNARGGFGIGQRSVVSPQRWPRFTVNKPCPDHLITYGVHIFSHSLEMIMAASCKARDRALRRVTWRSFVYLSCLGMIVRSV